MSSEMGPKQNLKKNIFEALFLTSPVAMERARTLTKMRD